MISISSVFVTYYVCEINQKKSYVKNDVAENILQDEEHIFKNLPNRFALKYFLETFQDRIVF